MAKGKALEDDVLDKAASGYAKIYKDTEGKIVGADFYADDDHTKWVGSQALSNLADVKKAADFFGVSDEGHIIESYDGFKNLENKKT